MNQPAPEASKSILGWLGPALVHAGLAVAIFTTLVWLGPRADRFYRDMNMNLPALTTAVLAVVRWMGNYWYVVVPPLVALLAADTVVLWLLNRQSSKRARRGFWLGVIFLGLVWGVLAVGYFYPMLKLYEGLSR
jgi:type II secretory pathway component PulF